MKLLSVLVLLAALSNCKEDEPAPDEKDPEVPEVNDTFYFGADLSYVNQILDKGGVYMDSGVVESPYETFAQHGVNVARFRLWHNPTWTQEVYGTDGSQMYSDLADVTRGIQAAKNAGMPVLLDIHYSDDWADPGNQKIPAAWQDIKSIGVLRDSVYKYTLATLTHLNSQGLKPEMVQVGNETNCGMLYSEAPTGFPDCNLCDGNGANLKSVIAGAIEAIREVDGIASTDTKIILHVADPVNVDWWFGQVTEGGQVRDFDIIGFSYYPIWHTGVSLSQLPQRIAAFKKDYGKDVIILETAYPWTTDFNDNYNNQFGEDQAISGYPITPKGQTDLLKNLTQRVIDGGGIGLIYWEPAWISSDLKDRWGTGSSMENCAFYDYDGHSNHGFDFITATYDTK